MKSRNLICNLCLSLLVMACTPRPEVSKDEVVENKQVYQINFEESLGVEKPLMLSEIADTIEYLQLKTPKGVTIAGIRQIVITNDFIFLISYGNPYQFRRDGSFVRQVGSRGKGPGEYHSAGDIAFDEKTREILIFDGLFGIHYYRSDGSFIRTQKLKLNTAIAKTDSVIWTERFPLLGIFKHMVVAFGPDMDTLCVIPNHVLFKNKNGNIIFFVGSKYQKSLYYYNNTPFFKGPEDNDTIWGLQLPQPEVHAVIKMGKYKLPVDYRADYSRTNFEKHAKDYYGIPRIFEDSRYFYLMAQTRFSDGSYYPMIFDKQSGNGFVVKNDKVQGITDDLLHGPSFWPFFISDEYYIGAVEAYKLMEQLKGTESAYFKKLLSTIDENSNQLLILCKRK